MPRQAKGIGLDSSMSFLFVAAHAGGRVLPDNPLAGVLVRRAELGRKP